MPKVEQAPADVLERLRRLANNLWWSWNPDAQRLFASLDPKEWTASNQSPKLTLGRLGAEALARLAEDPRFMAHLERVEGGLDDYLRHPSWFSRRRGKRRLRVAYFSAEFGLHESFPIYCGGLGVLAGDHLKSASDLGVPVVGVGLLYRRGYYSQELTAVGQTRVIKRRHRTEDLPVVDTGRRITIDLGRRKVVARIWRAEVGRVPLYLLDTDLAENRPHDRTLTDDLYGGDAVYRLEQEILLGVGGMRALGAVGEAPTVFHLNEGHAAFCALERLRRLREEGRSDQAARAEVRRTTVFTTHTPVAAGHDRFAPALVLRYLGGLAERAGLGRDDLLALGRENPSDRRESFCMTVLALKLAARVNGVSRLHGAVSRRMWMGVYGAEEPDRVPIQHVTNGVHTETWLAPELRPLYDKYLAPRWLGAGPEHDPWRRAGRIPLDELWRLRNLLRQRMVGFIRQRLVEQALRAHASAEEVAEAGQALSEHALTIGFARRFATYKRAPLVFRDPDRLLAILGDAERPVQLVFAGKAHPADPDGQAFVRQVFRRTRERGLRGKVVFVEDYDMGVGRMLISGCDVWLNNPTRPYEASGTSGMKPPLHGGLNCSVLDGWWPEAFDGKNGWEIGGGREFRSQSAQDRHDAASIYSLLEQAIIPTFYRRDRHDIPRRWLELGLHSMQTVCARFSTHRMVGDYLERYYLPALEGKGAQ
jgi:glycogen phosphorylase